MSSTISLLEPHIDLEYKQFNEKIQNTNYPLLGVRIPILRKLSKQIAKDPSSFLQEEHHYFEEIMMEGFVIAYMNMDLKQAIPYINNYLTKIDNWGLCDSFVSSLKKYNKNPDEFYKYVSSFQNSTKEYELRFMIVCFLDYFIIDKYVDNIIEIITKINIHTYYIDMAIAWLIAELAITQYDKITKIFKNCQLDKFIINKAISKIRDSYRIEQAKKDYLKQFRQK